MGIAQFVCLPVERPQRSSSAANLPIPHSWNRWGKSSYRPRVADLSSFKVRCPGPRWGSVELSQVGLISGIVTATWPPLHLIRFKEQEDSGTVPAAASVSTSAVQTRVEVDTRNSRPGAVTRYFAAVSDIDRRVFCLLSCAQAYPDHGSVHEDDEW